MEYGFGVFYVLSLILLLFCEKIWKKAKSLNLYFLNGIKGKILQEKTYEYT